MKPVQLRHGEIALSVLTSCHCEEGTRNRRKLEAVVLLHVYIEDLEVMVWFGAVNDFAADILLGTFFMDCYLRWIFSSVTKNCAEEFEICSYQRDKSYEQKSMELSRHE